MSDRVKDDTDMVAMLLSLSEKEVALFVRQCVRDRSLSSIISDLNNQILFGSEQGSEEARQALSHIGFV